MASLSLELAHYRIDDIKREEQTLCHIYMSLNGISQLKTISTVNLNVN